MSDPSRSRPRPFVIEGDDPALFGPAPSPADAPQPDEDAASDPRGDAAAAAIHRAARPGRAGALSVFLASAAGFVTLALLATAYDWVAGLVTENPALAAVAAALGAAAALALLVVLARELRALMRLGRIDAARTAAERAHREGDRRAAERALDRVAALYAGRADLEWAASRVAERRGEMIDAESLLTLAEREYLAPLDREARRIAERSARQAATATALVPIPAADVAAALLINLRMIRAVAEVYGGRAGTLGAWRLFKAVASHLVATGAVAATDDLLGPVLGGGVLARLSRRFGEGLVNGALTARVGVAAMEVCRPLPFDALPAPKARNLVARGLGDLVGAGGGGGGGAAAAETGAAGRARDL